MIHVSPIVGLLFFVLDIGILTSWVWVFIDAGRRDLTNSVFYARWGWMVAVIAFWIIFFPLYLTDRRRPLGRGNWTAASTDDLPREDLLSLWEGVDPADMDRITRRALKHAAAARGNA